MKPTLTEDTVFRLGVAALLLVCVAGAFLPGPGAWGFNELAYLPHQVLWVWIAGAAFAIFLAFGRPGPKPDRSSTATADDRAATPQRGTIREKAARYVLDSGSAPWLLSLLAGLLFFLLRSRSNFLGDGLLFGNLTGEGIPFHGYDDMHYAIASWLYRVLVRWRALDVLTTFRAGSIVAGMLGIFLTLSLTRRLSWEPRRKLLVLGFLLGTSSIVLFFGYVEAYSFVLAFLMAFGLAGILVLEGRAPLWWAGALFALAVFFQLTAIFSAPALLYLALRAPEPSWKRRWAALILPSVAPVLIWILVHLVLGRDQRWVLRGFLGHDEARRIFIPWFGPHALFSLGNGKDLLNLALLTVPVPGWLLISHPRAVRRRIAEPAVQFLLIQAVVWVVLNILLERELGTARDWDLLAAQSSGLVILAALIWAGRARPAVVLAARVRSGRTQPAVPPGAGSALSNPAPPKIAGALLASALITLLWVLLVHRDQDSGRWLTDAARDFGDPAQPYAYEALGQHFRDQGDIDQAVRMYERCVDTGPDNPRFRVNLGTMYAAEGKADLARRQYDAARTAWEAALRADPQDYAVKQHLAQILEWENEPARAAELYQELTTVLPADASLWAALGRCALAADRFDVAARALAQALNLNPHLPIRRDLAVAWMASGRFEEAAAVFRRALEEQDDPALRLGLAAASVSEAEARLHAGERPTPRNLDDAEEQLRIVLQRNPDDSDARDLLRRVQLLREGRDPEATPGSEP